MMCVFSALTNYSIDDIMNKNMKAEFFNIVVFCVSLRYNAFEGENAYAFYFGYGR